MPGIMFPTYNLLCGKCPRELHTRQITQAKAAEVANKRGWWQVSYYGWVCPDCVKKERSK